MDKVRLRVKTVPVSDLFTHETCLIYTVINDDCEAYPVSCASGMTLRDAITSYCGWFHSDRDTIELIRPFLPHGWKEDGNQ